ncbi:MAG: UDP-N-acetylmuramoyl-tripeptide--D-alanyl-D-alanine ligase [Candidatus Marinimicrobia bacterium]|nr:UDP-N-acetylmuramoyl-tripeptide--D-alanyl-D-alanine ligase [Candidatus Neomarinimicrobiota bacterium]
MKLNIQQIESISYGKLLNLPDTFDSSAVIDSRKLEPGMLFCALRGEHVDGHEYVLAAFEKKPAFCIVEKTWYNSNKISLFGKPIWVVENSEKALQLLAAKVREISDIPLLALTGTNGKTSTRSMIVSVLNQNYHVLSTMGNLNNHLGLPLSILQIQEHHDFAVMEMGTNHFGEIEFLCQIAKPNFGLITNIGRGHTEFLESPEGVARAKEELFRALPREGTIFLNADDKYISKMNYKVRNLIRYGMNSDDVAYHGTIVATDFIGRSTLNVNNQIEINVPIPGKYQAFNALAAVAVGHRFGVSLEKIKEAIENHSGVGNRLGFRVNRYKILDDTYNANPESTLAAIDTLSGIQTVAKKYFVLGDMLELGEKKESYHREMGTAVAGTDINFFLTLGPLAFYAGEAAEATGHCNWRHFTTKIDMINYLKTHLTQDDMVLIKGSRGSRMEEILEGLES